MWNSALFSFYFKLYYIKCLPTYFFHLIPFISRGSFSRCLLGQLTK